MLRAVLAVICLGWVAPGGLGGQSSAGVVVGRVIDEEGRFIPNADVVFVDLNRVIRAGPVGRFTVQGVPPGRQTLMARAIVFRPRFVTLHVLSDDTTFALLRLKLIPHLIPTLETTALPLDAGNASSRRRSGSGLGYFIDQAAFEAAHPISISQFLRRFTVLQIVDSAGVPEAISRRGPKVVASGAVMTSVPCVMRTAVDGQLLPWGTSLDLVTTNAVAAIEIFTGPATVPTEFGGQSRDMGCGLVAIWTRRQ